MPAKSRQRAWQKKMVSQSRCMICGGARGSHPGYCDLHYRNQVIRIRKTAGEGGCKPWKPGHTGRPPVDSTSQTLTHPGHTGRPPVDSTSQTLTHLAKQLKQMGYRITPIEGESENVI
jgi:hypothetical protein